MDADQLWRIQGEEVTSDTVGSTLRIQVDGQTCYLKRYRRAGRRWWRGIAPSRAAAERRNMQRLADIGVPVPAVLAWHQWRRFGVFRGAVLLLEAVPDARDLAAMAAARDPRLADPVWRRRMSVQLAEIVARMHQARFIHNDLKWRNVLVSGDDRLVLIDVPAGGWRRGIRLRWGRDKDLATLDVLSAQNLSRTDRLRLYLAYRGLKKLDAAGRRQIRRVLRYLSAGTPVRRRRRAVRAQMRAKVRAKAQAQAQAQVQANSQAETQSQAQAQAQAQAKPERASA